jgi:glycosyltransferase involved in cell wall biosynthesis
MKRVLVIEPSGNLWGSERALLDLLDSLQGFKVAVCCPPQVPLNIELEKRGIRIFPYYIYGLHKKSRLDRLLAATGVLRACLRFQPDLIYLNQCGAYRTVLSAATLLNVPIVAHIRLFEDAAYLARKSPSPHRLRGIIAITSAIEAEIRRFRALDYVPLHRLYDGYFPALPESENVYPPKRRHNRIACVGRLAPIKGQNLLIDALCMSKRFKENGECLLAGEGEDEFVYKLKENASRANLTYSIHWLGFVNDVISLLRTCSVLVCPSYNEPLGRVIIEAWDAGAVPVVFSGSGGAAEIVAAAQAGILYERQTPECLARALRCALGLNDADRERLLNNGRSWMTKNCDPQIYGEKVSIILQDVCAQRSN